MKCKEILKNSSAGLLITDQNFKIVWANRFEEDFYNMSLEEMIGLWVVDCHKEENKDSIDSFLQKFKTGEITEFTKIADGMAVTYSSYHHYDEEFAGIVRTRIRLPEKKL